jgi:hypothetical protein
MKTRLHLGGALVVPVLLWGGTALAQATPPQSPNQANTPQTVSGEVVKIDRSHNRVTIRGADGTMHEFQASADTLKDLKEGDRLEARLRRR